MSDSANVLTTAPRVASGLAMKQAFSGRCQSEAGTHLNRLLLSGSEHRYPSIVALVTFYKADKLTPNPRTRKTLDSKKGT